MTSKDVNALLVLPTGPIKAAEFYFTFEANKTNAQPLEIFPLDLIERKLLQPSLYGRKNDAGRRQPSRCGMIHTSFSSAGHAPPW